MTDAQKVTVFICEVCHDEHDCEQDAWDCCPTDYYTEERWECECLEKHYTKEDAEACCTDED